MEKKYTYKIFRSFATLIVALLSFYSQAIGSNVTLTYAQWNGTTIKVTNKTTNTVVLDCSSCGGTTSALSEGTYEIHMTTTAWGSYSLTINNATSISGSFSSGSYFTYSDKKVTLYKAANEALSETFYLTISAGDIVSYASTIGPNPGTITSPNPICGNTSLNLSVTGSSGTITSSGWKIYPTNNYANAQDWTNGSVMTVSQSTYNIWYWASDGTTTNHTAPVQVTVNSCGPTITGTLTAPTVCDLETLTMTAPSVSGETSKGWKINSTNDFATAEAWTNGSVMTYSQNGYYLWYWASDGTITNYTTPVQVTVNPLLTGYTLTTNNGTLCDDTKLTLDTTRSSCYNTTASYYTVIRQVFKDESFLGGAINLNETLKQSNWGVGDYYVNIRITRSGKTSIYTTDTITISDPSISVDQSSLSLQNLYGATSATGTITASVAKACSATTSYELTGTDAAKFSITSVDNVYTVTFNEKTTPGTYTATLRIKSTETVYQDVTITGTVPTPSMSIAPTSLAFANELGGSAAQKTFTVTLTNVGPGTVTATSSNPTDFEVVSVAPNYDNTYIVTVSFKNTTVEGSDYAGTITVGVDGVPIITSQTVSVTGIVACNPPEIVMSKYNDACAISDFMTCGCNSSWYATYTINSTSNPYFTIKEDGSFMDDETNGGKIRLGSLVSRQKWSDPMFRYTGIMSVGDHFYIVLTNKGSYYELTITSPSTPPTCSPIIDNITLDEVCKNDNIDLSAFVPTVSASGTISAQGWQYSTDNATWNNVTTPTAFTASQKYYIRYYVTDENGTGYSASTQIQYKASVVGTLAAITGEYCNNATILLTAPTYTAPSCGTTTAGFEYSSNNGTSYTQVTNPASFSLPSAGTYLIRFFVETPNGKDYSNAVSLSIYGPPAVSEMAIPAAICNGEDLSITVPDISSYFAVTAQGWQTSSDGVTYTTGFTGTDVAASYNNQYLQYYATNTCGTGTNTARTMTINSPNVDITNYTTKVGASSFAQTVATVTTTSSCVNEITYTLSDASGFFEIDAASGTITSKSTVTAGTYPMTVTATTTDYSSNPKTDNYSISITIINSPGLNIACPEITTVNTNRCETDNQVQFSLVTANLGGLTISYELSGDAAKYFSIPSSSYTPTTNAETTIITASQATSMAAGTYPMTLTATVTAPDPYGVITATCNEVSIVVSKIDDVIGAAISTTDADKTIYCSETLDVEASSAATDVNRYDWFVDGVKQATTTEDNTTLSFDCTGANRTVPILVQMQNVAGCLDTASIKVTLLAYDSVYYYCGPTGASSDVTNPQNWCTVENANTLSCIHPKNFTTSGRQYIINKDDVKLLSGQTWTVSGTGSKITLGDGWWQSSFTKKYGTSNLYYYDIDGDGHNNTVYCEFYGTLPAAQASAFYTNVYNADYRADAKTFAIEGTLNAGGIDIDVNCGSELQINTDAGSYNIGDCATTYQLAGTSNDGGTGDRYNIMLIPGSIVTYNNAGANVVQAASYADLYVNTPNAVTFGDGDLVVFQSFKLEQTPASTDAEGTNVIFAGSYDQAVPSMTYDNLALYNSNTKTLTGDITVAGVLNIASGCTLDADDSNITLTGCNDGGVVVDYEGEFDAGTSTVYYTGNCEQVVAALPYYNLNVDATGVTTETRTFSSKDIVGVAGTFTVDPSLTNTSAYTTTNSTVEFNGTSGQTMPSFTYYNLEINNSGLKDGGSLTNTNNFLSMSGDVVVTNQLHMAKGVLNTNGKNLTVKNTSANAVLDGYYNSDTDQSFIEGTLTRYLPENLTNDADVSKYVYPVGDYTLGGYMPLTVQGVTTGTGSTPIISVSVETTTPNTTLKDSPLSTVNSSYYWNVNGNASYTAGRVTLSTPRGDQSLISSAEGTTLFNCVAYENGSNPWIALNGTTVSPKLIKAYPQGSGLYTFGTRTVTYKTYYYNCTSSYGITDLRSWTTDHCGAGTQATSFSSDYTTWIIESDATISSNFSITGSNTHVILQGKAPSCGCVKYEPKLTIAGGVTNFVAFETKTSSDGTKAYATDVVVAKGGELNVYETFVLGTKESTITNNGTMNIYVEDFVITDAWVTNNGLMNFYNCDLAIKSATNSSINANCYDQTNTNQDQSRPGTSSVVGHFLNYGTVDMTNSGLYTYGRFTQLYNADGAVWKIDNSTSAIKRTIDFDYSEIIPTSWSDLLTNAPYNYINLECGSTFYVVNSDVDMGYVGNVTAKFGSTTLTDNAIIGGTLIVEDGNFYIGREGGNGGNVTLLDCAKVLLYDTDNSGDAILNVDGVGGTTFNVYGSLYAMGLVAASTQSGSSFNIKDGGSVFIGDMGATLPGFSWQYTINVQDGGVLNYCGNRTSVADNIGTNNGYLNYAESFYVGTSPIEEGDFTNIVPGDAEPLFASIAECMAAYNTGATGATAELLPIELTMLYGICTDEAIELHWQTMSETNSDFFSILRSFDGVTFEEIETVFASGTTTEIHNYSCIDKVNYSGVVYYKLRQYDYDGKYTDSKIIAVQTCGKNAHFLFKENEIEVTFENPAVRNFVVITSITGKIVYSKAFEDVETARLAMPQALGTYIISVIDNKQITSEKFINK